LNGDRILRREKPEDLPFRLPTKYELIANLKTANTHGIAPQPGLPAATRNQLARRNVPTHSRGLDWETGTSGGISHPLVWE
jgi:hypothetical protein